MAENQAQTEQAKKDAELRKQQQEQRDKTAKAKPTPTQEENDRAKMGEHIKEHAEDGSGPDPNVAQPAGGAHKPSQGQHQK